MNILFSAISTLGLTILVSTMAIAQPTAMSFKSIDFPAPITTVNPTAFASNITSKGLKEHLEILASDDFEGRETGTPGNEKAANYIADIFKSYGLPALGKDQSYFQPVIFNWTSWATVGIKINGQQFRHLREFVSFPARNQEAIITTDEILFLGYGIDDPQYSDYDGVDVKGKVIMIYKNEPVDKANKSYITGTLQLSDWSSDWQKKLITAKDKGVHAVLLIDNEIQKVVNENRRFLVGPTMTLGSDGMQSKSFANNCLISTNVARAIMGDQLKKIIKARKKIQKKGKSKNVSLTCNFELTQEKENRQLVGNNVLGYIEGTDDKLKNELVIITAHYDHLGKRGDAIYNGADDNGSGTATVLEIAEAFVLAKKQNAGPKRSVLCMLVTGEEKGLLGSKYYSEKPIFPLTSTVANVNVDMVGRSDKKHSANPKYIYVIGSNRLSTELHNINEKVNQEYTQLELDYTYNEEDDPNRYYYRSDHYNFAEKGIPAIFYFSGTHEDYHRTSDTVEKIDFEKMELIGQLIFYTSWELANRNERIEVDVKP